MVTKLNDKFIPKDYQVNLFRRLQNLRHKGLTIREYMEQFYRLNIRAEHRERNEEKVSRYINGPRYEIKDEISMVTMRTVEDAYQVSLKVEEKLVRKKIQRGKGKIPHIGKGIVNDKAQKPIVETRKFHSHTERGGSSQGRHYGRRNYFPRGRERERVRGGEVK
jgi:hypothetical protein